MGAWATIKADVATVKAKGHVSSFFFPSAFAVLTYRAAHALGRRGFTVPARLITMISTLLTGAEIEWTAEIGPGLYLVHPVGVIIGPGVVIGSNVVLGGQVVLGATWNESRSRPSEGFPSVGDGAWILLKASVIGPVDVGEEAVVGAHALVLSDVPAGAVARGAPARSYVDGQRVTGNAPDPA